jgi:tRNA dimethylallyltransferase
MLLPTIRAFTFLSKSTRQLSRPFSEALRMSDSSSVTPNNLVVVIAGPTATGKSDVAARLCAKEKGIILSADSVQAYRHVQIGANKPSGEERKETPHILIDVADHTQNYNAAEWREDANSAIQDLLAETKINDKNPRKDLVLDAIKDGRLTKGYKSDEKLLPVVCGGTMMYLQWLVHGAPDAIRPSTSAVEKAYAIISKFQDNDDFEGALEHVASYGQIFSKRIAKFCGEDWVSSFIHNKFSSSGPLSYNIPFDL